MANLAGAARTVQNLQLWLVFGLLVGFGVGVLIAAYVVYPLGDLWIFIAVFLSFVTAWIGQRVVLSWLAER